MPLSYIAASDLLNELLHRNVESAREKLEKPLAPNLDGLTVKRLVLEGNPAIEIVRTAQREKADIIIMPTHGYGALMRFLWGSVTAKVLHNSGCPVWTGAHLEHHPSESFAIRKVLCVVRKSWL